MYPDTRGRISTDSTGSSRPVNSSHSFTSFSTTVTTLTGKAACCVTGAFLQPLPVKKTNKKAAHAKKNCFIQSDSHSFELIANRGFWGRREMPDLEFTSEEYSKDLGFLTKWVS